MTIKWFTLTLFLVGSIVSSNGYSKESLSSNSASASNLDFRHAIESANYVAITELLHNDNIKPNIKGYYLQLAKEKQQNLSNHLVSLQKEKSFKSASYLPISIVSIITGVYLGFLPARLIGWERLTEWKTRGLFEFWFATVASIGSGLYGGVKLGKTATKHLSIETENNIALTQTKIKDIGRIIALLEKETT